MTLPPQITPVQHAGYAALQLRTRHGTAVLALHGAHLLSWVPQGQQDVLWLSPAALPVPAPIRGGVPVCWPWFAKQGQALSALQHGPVRGLPWEITAIPACSDDEIHLSLAPALATMAAAGLWPPEGVPAGLNVRLDIRLGQELQQNLVTHNDCLHAFSLSQALHTYYAVSDARTVRIEGLNGLRYQDRLKQLAFDTQREPFTLNAACDRTYEQTPGKALHRYRLIDPAWARCIEVQTEGSQSVVVWNPGSEGAQKIVDLADDGWLRYFCIEACNAGPDVVPLAPGASHRLTQTLRVLPLDKP